MATTSTLPMACISPFDFYKHYLMTSTHSHGFYNNLTASFGILSGPLSLSWPIFASSWPLLALLWPLVLSGPIMEFSVPHEHSNGFFNNLNGP